MRIKTIIAAMLIGSMCQAQSNSYFSSHNTTFNPPVVVQYGLTSLSQESVTLQYTVATNGLYISAKGVCFATTAYPTLTSGATVNSTNTLAFSNVWEQYLTGLTPGTKYYFNHYATYLGGTAYDDWGGVANFTTLYYNFGYLYNWWAAIGCIDGDGVSERSIAPSGWHLPTSAEYDALIDYMPVMFYPQTQCFAEFLASDKFWNQSTVPLSPGYYVNNNASGMNIYPAGYRFGTSGYLDIYNTARLWSSTASEATYSHSMRIDYNWQEPSAIVALANYAGASIRLIKDNSTDPGTVTDYDGNVYPTVKIGNQVWMAQNLKVQHFNDGTDIPAVTSNTTWVSLTSFARCVYANIEGYK